MTVNHTSRRILRVKYFNDLTMCPRVNTLRSAHDALAFAGFPRGRIGDG